MTKNKILNMNVYGVSNEHTSFRLLRGNLKRNLDFFLEKNLELATKSIMWKFRLSSI